MLERGFCLAFGRSILGSNEFKGIASMDSFDHLVIATREALYGRVDAMTPDASAAGRVRVEKAFDEVFEQALPQGAELGHLILDVLRIHPQAIATGPETNGRSELKGLVRHLVLADARARAHNKEIVVDFEIDADANRAAEDPQRHAHSDLAHVLGDARFICESVEDNDLERWFLTMGGQFIRETGMGGGRYYVIPADEAEQMLTSLGVEDHAMAGLRESGAFNQPAPSP